MSDGPPYWRDTQCPLCPFGSLFKEVDADIAHVVETGCTARADY